MNIMKSGLLRILLFTGTILLLSIGYFIYVYNTYPAIQENESMLGEIGEGLGELGLWGLVFIYGRTFLKLILGKGKIAQRLLPEYSLDLNISIVDRLLQFLNSTHIYVGIATIAVILLHITFMGIPMDILFFTSLKELKPMIPYRIIPIRRMLVLHMSVCLLVEVQYVFVLFIGYV